jgi:hypothetical protein
VKAGSQEQQERDKRNKGSAREGSEASVGITFPNPKRQKEIIIIIIFFFFFFFFLFYLKEGWVM